MVDLFESRPSKDEDLEEIQRLREEINAKDLILRRAQENIDFYKNTLINNEESYNGYFGNNPKVGVINPLQKSGTGVVGNNNGSNANGNDGNMKNLTKVNCFGH